MDLIINYKIEILARKILNCINIWKELKGKQQQLTTNCFVRAVRALLNKIADLALLYTGPFTAAEVSRGGTCGWGRGDRGRRSPGEGCLSRKSAVQEADIVDGDGCTLSVADHGFDDDLHDNIHIFCCCCIRQSTDDQCSNFYP